MGAVATRPDQNDPVGPECAWGPNPCCSPQTQTSSTRLKPAKAISIVLTTHLR